jgi:hypothetical protein
MLFLNTFAYAETQNVILFADDVSQGSNAVISTSKISTHTNVNFFVTSPEQQIKRFSGKTDSDGIARITLPKSNLESTGEYEVRAFLVGVQDQKNPSTFFSVFAPKSDPSLSYLEVKTDKSISANGKTKAHVRLVLKNANSQPVSGNKVKLIPKRSIDTVISGNFITDANGIYDFFITSETPGIAEFRAIDLTTNTIIQDIASITFQKTSSLNNEWMKAFGSIGDFLKADTSDVFDPENQKEATSLEIISPDSVTLGTPFSVTVRALTIDNEPAKNFQKQIIFTVEGDDNAIIPLEDVGYTFKAGESEHTFENAFIFNAEGSKKLIVNEITDFALFSEISINVTNEDETSGSDVTILSPTDQSSFSSNLLHFEAKGAPHFDFHVYDNGAYTKTVSSDANGNIAFDIDNLTAGLHDFIIHQIDADANIIESSASIRIELTEIDVTTQNIRIDPAQEMETGTLGKITIETSSPLDSGLLLIGDQSIPLQKIEGENTYEAEFYAPEVAGEYDINFEFTGMGGKLYKLLKQGKVQVIKKEIPLPVLENFKGEGKDQFINLQWNTLPDESLSAVKDVHVFMAENAFAFDDAQEYIVDKNTNTLTIKNLTNNKAYYFYAQIVGIDTEKSEKSSLISVIPESDEILFEDITIGSLKTDVMINWKISHPDKISEYKVRYGVRSGEYLESVTIAHDNFLDEQEAFISYLVSNQQYYFQVVGYDIEKIQVAQTNEFSYTVPEGDIIKGSAPENKVCNAPLENVRNLKIIRKGQERILSWDEVIGATSYHIYAGKKPDQLYPLTIENSTSVRLKLPQDKQYYYFAIKALCQNDAGKILQATHITEVAKVGFETFILFIISFCIFIISRMILKK